MPINRFFSEHLTKTSKEITLDEQEFHHLARVTRTQAGESVELMNGEGLLAKAIVKKITKNEAALHIEEVREFPPLQGKCTLVQAIPKLNRLEIVLEKGTELGASEFWLFPSDRGEKFGFSPTQAVRLKTIILSAAKQSGRLYLPKICFKNHLAAWDYFPDEGYYGKLSPDIPFFADVLAKKTSTQEAFFFIGPESGFSEKELLILEKHHIQGVSLNRNILRTETAAITALAIYFGSSSHSKS